MEALLLEAIARDALGDPDAAGRALERALDLAKPDAMLFPFLQHPAENCSSATPRHGTAHAALIAEILNLLAQRESGAMASAWQREGLGGLSPRENTARAAQPGRDPRPALHTQLDSLTAETRAAADTVAERAVTLGYAPDGRAATVAKESPLAEVPGRCPAPAYTTCSSPWSGPTWR